MLHRVPPAFMRISAMSTKPPLALLISGLIAVTGVTTVSRPTTVPRGPVGDRAARTKDAGASVRADFNGDGYADLAAGVRFETLGTLEWAGAVNVLYGSPGGVQATAPDDQFWTQDSPRVKDVAETHDFFGASLAAGDFNGDGYDDLAIGGFWEGVGAATQAGAVNVLYGSAGGLQADAPDDQFWTEDTAGVKEV